jgi:hypothetical protein
MTETIDQIQDEQDQIRQRREKLTALREETIAFPTDFRRFVIKIAYSDKIYYHN